VRDPLDGSEECYQSVLHRVIVRYLDEDLDEDAPGEPEVSFYAYVSREETIVEG